VKPQITTDGRRLINQGTKVLFFSLRDLRVFRGEQNKKGNLKWKDARWY